MRASSFIILAAIGLTCVARGDESLRPRRPEELKDAKRQKAVRVVGARVSYVNFAAVRRDFPEIAHLSEPQIARWVLDNFAYVSEEQLKLNGIRNSDIPTDPSDTKDNHRPKRYRRAGVLEATHDGKPLGLVDVKGLGQWDGGADPQVEEFRKAAGRAPFVNQIRAQDHSDGLMAHGEAVAEVVRQTAVQRLFDIHNHAHGTNHQTVESYFVIELPFALLGPDGKGRDRAALYGRQAHWRGESGVSVPPGTYRDPFGNRQGTRFGSSVDFGAVLVDQHPLLREAFGVWPGQPEKDPQKSKPWAWGHDVARAFERGDTAAVYRHIEEMLAPIREEWLRSEPGTGPREGPMKTWAELARLARKPDATPAELERIMDFLVVPRAGEPEATVARLLVAQMDPANKKRLNEMEPAAWRRAQSRAALHDAGFCRNALASVNPLSGLTWGERFSYLAPFAAAAATGSGILYVIFN